MIKFLGPTRPYMNNLRIISFVRSAALVALVASHSGHAAEVAKGRREDQESDSSISTLRPFATSAFSSAYRSFAACIVAIYWHAFSPVLFSPHTSQVELLEPSCLSSSHTLISSFLYILLSSFYSSP